MDDPIPPAALHRPVDDWPLLLAGPILRRVTDHSVAVFLAARESFTATLTVFDGTDASATEMAGAPGVAPSLALGRSLHVCVVEQAGIVLLPGRVYGYGVELETADGPHTLGSLGLLAAPLLLGYVPGALPGFVLPWDADRLRVAHGSCRKFHGCDAKLGLDPDLLPLADRLIGEHRTDPAQRLQQLVLTGDQVYSDDVPAAVLAALTSAGRDLLAWEEPERFPLAAGGAGLRDDDARLAPGKRSYFLDAEGVKDRPAGAAGWYEYAANHLLFFSEWCAIYLFAWSDALWQPFTGPTVDGFHYTLPPAEDVWADSPPTTGPALTYAQTTPLVRRALANVATYMLFDDHDVTDDWFLNGTLEAQQRGAPGGRRLMRNALAAYAVFQHWGNRPEDFAARTRGRALLDLLDLEGRETPLIGTPGNETAADVLLDVGREPVGVARAGERMRWDWELAWDAHRVIAFDTRTWREYPPPSAPIGVDELRAAAAHRTPVAGDWGPDALDALAEPWRDAAAAIDAAGESELGGFLAAGAELAAAAAAFARVADADADAATWKPPADAVMAQAGALVEAMLAAPGPQPFDWAIAALDAASSALAGSDNRSAASAAEGAFALGAALAEAFVRIDRPFTDFVHGIGLGALAPDEEAMRAAMQPLATLCFELAGFLEGAAVSRARGAAAVPEVGRAWIALATDGPPGLYGPPRGEVQEALTAAGLGSEAAADLLDAAAARHTAIADPVLALLSGASRLCAGLISAPALDLMVRPRVAAALDDPRELTFVVSPAVVFGHWLVDMIQRGNIIADEATGVAGDEDVDNEPWAGNVPAWGAFLEALAPLRSVVVLSGDVHYAFSSANEYRGASGKRARFVQLTSSALKNATGKTKLLGRAALPAQVAGSLVSEYFHVLHVLPSRGELEHFPEDLRDLIPAREDVIEGLGECATSDGGALGPLGVPALDPDEWRAALAAGDGDVWERAAAGDASAAGGSARATIGAAADATRAGVGDRVVGSAVMNEQARLLLDSFALNPDPLVDVASTMLLDRTAIPTDRFGPGLIPLVARMPPQTRIALGWSGTQTVGRDNLGVVWTLPTRLGRMVVHDLHWFPYDVPSAPYDPAVGGSFRDDWIVTRHVAGLQPGSPTDGGVLGVP